MLEKFKQLIWISTGGLLIGTIVRRGYDSIWGIPDITDSSIVDLGSILLGGSFVLLWIWTILTVLGILDHKPWTEAKEQWERFHSSPKGFPRLIFLCLRSLTTVGFLVPYFIVALIAFAILTSWDVFITLQFFGWWCAMVFGSWLLIVSQRKKSLAQEQDILGGNIVKLLDLPEQPGRFITNSLLVAFIFCSLQYNKISQSFGGGRPEKVIVFLKSEQPANTSSSFNLDGKVADLLFRRGTKLGFRVANMSEGQFVVIDQSQIDHLYVGNKIQGLDLSKLK
jgi:hypothetical protein